MQKQGRTNNTFIWAIVGWIVFTLIFGGGFLGIPSFSNLVNNTSNGSTITDVPTPYDNNNNKHIPTFTFKQFLNYLLLFIVLILIYLYIYFRIKKKKGKQDEEETKRTKTGLAKRR
jgi:hypothetical protein